MGIPIDADIFFLLAAVGSVLGSLPRLRSLPTSRIPVRYEIQEVLQDALTEAQAKFLAPYDEKLGSMNYLPLCTYRVLNYGHNLLRNYVSPMDTARCVVMIYEIPVENGGSPIRRAVARFIFIHGLLTARSSRHETCRSSRLRTSRRTRLCKNAPAQLIQRR
jgi:hypothetical protein